MKRGLQKSTYGFPENIANTIISYILAIPIIQARLQCGQKHLVVVEYLGDLVEDLVY